MIEIYHGDGKGKTTASVGLAVRVAGRNMPVIFAQFLKDDSSGEIHALKKLSQIRFMHPSVFYGFVSRMSEQELAETKDAYEGMLNDIEDDIVKYTGIAEKKEQSQDNCDYKTIDGNEDIKLCVILDEVLHALHYKLLSEDTLVTMLKKYSDKVEFVLTGRNPSARILEFADYVTEMKKEKHPFDRGITARRGIEF